MRYKVEFFLWCLYYFMGGWFYYELKGHLELMREHDLQT
jgi:hypothetical protein